MNILFYIKYCIYKKENFLHEMVENIPVPTLSVP